MQVTVRNLDNGWFCRRLGQRLNGRSTRGQGWLTTNRRLATCESWCVWCTLCVLPSVAKQGSKAKPEIHLLALGLSTTQARKPATGCAAWCTGKSRLPALLVIQAQQLRKQIDQPIQNIAATLGAACIARILRKPFRLSPLQGQSLGMPPKFAPCA